MRTQHRDRTEPATKETFVGPRKYERNVEETIGTSSEKGATSCDPSNNYHGVGGWVKEENPFRPTSIQSLAGQAGRLHFYFLIGVPVAFALTVLQADLRL